MANQEKPLITPLEAIARGELVRESPDQVAWYGPSESRILADLRDQGWTAQGDVTINGVRHGCSFAEPTFPTAEEAIAECIRRLRTQIDQVR